ncbi:hypothetical protein L1987_87481 [Smallanthus sonchifolius]|nr:hypothetical protein L1987_87481 [Smallanthus sonchifolius]
MQLPVGALMSFCSSWSKGGSAIVPVFYHVEPADVRKQTGSFAIGVKPSSRWTDENVNKWKKALMEVADLSGFTVSEYDVDYVVKILEPDYSAKSGIQTLINRYLLSVSPNKKIMMHRLVQEMVKNIVRQESTKFPEERSRVWLSSDYHKILRKGKGSKKIEGLALDMRMLSEENSAFQLMAVGGLTSDWFRILVGDTIDYNEVRGWRKIGRPKQVNDPSFTELKIIRCIIDGPELDCAYLN